MPDIPYAPLPQQILGEAYENEKPIEALVPIHLDELILHNLVWFQQYVTQTITRSTKSELIGARLHVYAHEGDILILAVNAYIQALGVPDQAPGEYPS